MWIDFSRLYLVYAGPIQHKLKKIGFKYDIYFCLWYIKKDELNERMKKKIINLFSCEVEIPALFYLDKTHGRIPVMMN